MIRIVFLVLIAGISIIKTGFSQDLHFRHYSVNEGLASSQVHDIIQDEQNRLWFTTDHGLSCYDGYAFKNYTTADGLTDNTVFKFFKGNGNEIWCTTFNKKLFYFNGTRPGFTPYKHNHILEKIPDPFVFNCLKVTADSSIFVSTIVGSGYIHINSAGKVVHQSIGKVFTPAQDYHMVLETGKKFAGFFFIHKAEKKLAEGEKKTLLKNLKGGSVATVTSSNVQACYMNGCAIFSSYSGLEIVPDVGPHIFVKSGFDPISLGKLNDSLFWVGLRYGGVKIYNLQGELQATYLEGKSVTKLYVDHEKGYWVSTLHDGVFHTINPSVSYYKHEQQDRNWVYSLSKDHEGKLWIGYYNGDVSYLFNRKINSVYIPVTKKPAVTCFNPHNNAIYYLSDYTVFTTKKSIPSYFLSNSCIRMMAFPNDSLLLASYNCVYTLHKGKRDILILGRRINDVCFHEGNFYLGSSKGLYKTVKDTALPYMPEKLSNLYVERVVSWNGLLVLATNNAGLILLKNNTMHVIDKRNGLNDNGINNIRIENDSVIWACTNTGLNRIVFNGNRIRHIDKITAHNGLMSNEITDVEILRDTVWVGTRQGLCCFPKALLKKTKKPVVDYKLKFTGLRVNDEPAKYKLHEAWAYYQNRIEFGFKGVSFSENRPLVYRYYLKGLENKWNYTTSRSALYSSLPSGEYTFIVEVKGENADWKTMHKSFSFFISPPFWKTWWFIIAVTAVIILLIYLFFRFRILSYNRDISRELLRQLLKRVRKKPMYVTFREQGKDIRIPTYTICFVKSDGNYLEIHTDQKKYVIRYKIGEFLDLVPDPLEYLRISRSCIVRLDKVQEKSKKDVTVKGEKLTVGETYLDQLEKIKF